MTDNLTSFESRFRETAPAFFREYERARTSAWKSASACATSESARLSVAQFCQLKTL